MTIKTLRDLLEHHQTALHRHRLHHAKRAEQYPSYPGIVRRKQQADQYKIDHHQQCVDVLQRTMEEMGEAETNTKSLINGVVVLSRREVS